jgi:hypothetical protein
MKELGLSWSEIKSTPRIELEGLLCSLAEYQVLHSMDGYDSDDVGKMAKQKPQVRSQYAKYMGQKAKYYKGMKAINKPTSFKEALKL